MLLLFVLLAVQGGGSKPASAPFQVIVNRASAVASLSRAEVSAIFMKRVRTLEPVEQSRLREDFSRQVHGKSAAYVTRYWQRVIFAGRGIPPPMLGSDAAVIDFVRANRRAIGYVGGDAVLPADVRIVTVTR